MSQTVSRGLVKNIERVDRNLCFLTLLSLDEDWVESRVPVYMEVRNNYVGRIVDVITKRKGLFGSMLEQRVEASGRSISIEIPYSLVKELNSKYRYTYES